MNVLAAIVLGFIVLGEAHHYYYVMRLGFKQHYSQRPSNTVGFVKNGIIELLLLWVLLNITSQQLISTAKLNS